MVMEMNADPREPEERFVLRGVLGSFLSAVAAGEYDAADAAKKILMEPLGNMADCMDAMVAALRARYASRPTNPRPKSS